MMGLIDIFSGTTPLPLKKARLFTASNLRSRYYFDCCEVIQPDLEIGPWIAGRSANKIFFGEDLAYSDWDIWAASQTQMNGLLNRISNKKIPLVFESDNARTFKTDDDVSIQIMRGFRTSWQDVIQNFDFTVAQFVTDGIDFRFAPTSVYDERNKILRLSDSYKMRSGLASRVFKYVTYGYQVHPDLMAVLKGPDISWEPVSDTYN